MGDFNNIRNNDERVGSCYREQGDNSIEEFNEWIADLEVEEAPRLGRKFTWYRPNGSVKSRLDIFLL